MKHKDLKEYLTFLSVSFAIIFGFALYGHYRHSKLPVGAWQFLPIPVLINNDAEKAVIDLYNKNFDPAPFVVVTDANHKDGEGIVIAYNDQIQKFGRRGHTVAIKTPYITRATIELDAIYLGDKKFMPSYECVLTHELGHALGFNAHADNSDGLATSIMAQPLTPKICKSSPDDYFAELQVWFERTYKTKESD